MKKIMTARKGNQMLSITKIKKLQKNRGIFVMDTTTSTVIARDLHILQKEATLSIISECNLLVDARALTNRLFTVRCSPLREQMLSDERVRSADCNPTSQHTTSPSSGK